MTRHPQASRSEPADYRPLGPAHAVIAGVALLATGAVAAFLVYVAFAIWLVMAS